MKLHSVYIHIPFCHHRCAYCDFNTYAGIMDLIPEYVNALNIEINQLCSMVDKRFTVHTIYFGGGTPSLISSSCIADILDTLDRNFDLTSDIEISLEANPGSLSLSYLQDLSLLGVNRLSLGMQSAQSGELAFLERQHQFYDVIDAVKWARQSGISNLSLDLIFGLPEQTIDVWNKTLTQALALEPEHFSLYALTIEEGTPLYHWASRGLVPYPNPDLVADMYELACDKLIRKGYMQYEISNWARVDNESQQLSSSIGNQINQQLSAVIWRREKYRYVCHHNLQYWRNHPYFGFGAGAHGYLNGYRISNILSPISYIQRLNQPTTLPNFPRSPATINLQSIDLQTEMDEFMMMGLRLTREGISRIEFKTRFNQDLSDVYGPKIEKLVGWKLLEWVGHDNDILLLTPSGRLLGNQVFREFV